MYRARRERPWPKYGGGKTKGQKYALDPSRLADIQSLANDGLVADEAVQRWL